QMMEESFDEEEYEIFEARHIGQLAAAAVPTHFWRRLYEKLTNETFDAGTHFQILAEESEDGSRSYSVVALNDIDASDPNNIFLVDHAWTFRPQVARQHLREIPGLLDRICAVVDIENPSNEETENYSDYGGSGDEADVPVEEAKPQQPADTDVAGSSTEMKHNASFVESVPASPSCGSMAVENDEDRRINEVLRRMWLYIHTYTMRFTDKEPDESDMPVWYMPDEFGVRIGHSANPNFRMVPMFYSPQNVAYSLLFPIRNVKVDELVTRDYVDSVMLRERTDWRPILMHPWLPVDLCQEKLQHIFQQDEFFTEGRTADILPINAPDTVPGHKGKLRVLAESCQLIDNLKNVEVEKVDRLEDADVIWTRKHFFDYRNLYEKNPKALVNQFPYETVLTVKDLLATSIQYAYKDSSLDPKTMRWPPSWFETTFNLNTELPQFVAYFQQRERRGLDNTWIIKPWNLARGLDMHVTDNLCYIIRLVESGPKIACKYIERPVLFRRPDTGHMVKFDLRYIVLVRSLRPPVIFLYNDFWIRFAINDFSLYELDDYETHLTVFNYNDSSKVLNMRCEDFTDQLEKMYPKLKWVDIQKKINVVIKEALVTLSSGTPPRSIAPNGQSRAMYGIDIMLKWDSDDEKTRNLEVSLIEGNFMPDCERACKFYPDFADTVFKTLFMDEEDLSKVTAL
uniref:Tubulin--tyrosine ligase-like protein 12 n=2 Tax=Parascaris univalens TaxID=6257 RepID=A0A915BCG8_PARUN